MTSKSDESNVAVLPEAPTAKPRPAVQPKRQPPYAVVILNDSKHTFPYVMDVLCTVFGYPTEKSYQLTIEAHKTGRSIVWSGPMETAEFKRDRIKGFGPDSYAMRPVTFPLGCFIEPLPQ